VRLFYPKSVDLKLFVTDCGKALGRRAGDPFSGLPVWVKHIILSYYVSMSTAARDHMRQKSGGWGDGGRYIVNYELAGRLYKNNGTPKSSRLEEN